MFGVAQMSWARIACVIAVGATGATIWSGVSAAASSGGYQACANSAGKLALENSRGNCPAKFNKVKVGAQGPRGPKGATGSRGPKGPSGVVSMTQYAPGGATAVTGSSYAFLGSPPKEVFTNTHTAALVTATVDEASTATSGINEDLGVCYEAVGDSTVNEVAEVEPAFAATGYFAQTVSGVVGNLAAGAYYVGVCAEDQTGVVNGSASVTIEVAQTSEGVTVDGVRNGSTLKVGRQ